MLAQCAECRVVFCFFFGERETERERSCASVFSSGRATQKPPLLQHSRILFQAVDQFCLLSLSYGLSMHFEVTLLFKDGTKPFFHTRNSAICFSNYHFILKPSSFFSFVNTLELDFITFRAIYKAVRRRVFTWVLNGSVSV